MNRRSSLLRALSAVSVAAALVTASALGTSTGASATVGSTVAGSVGSKADAPGVGLRSKFNFDAEGWTAFETGDPVFWASTGGNPGGNMAAQRGTGSATGISSPATWAGDRSGLLGGTLTFDLKLGVGVSSPFFEILLNSDDADVPLIFQHIDNPSGTLPGWTHYSLKIAPKKGWLINGSTGARKADFEKALSSLTSISITGSTSSSADTLYVDNVKAASDVDRSLSLAFKSNRFFGKITPAGGCAADAQVVLWRVRPGPDSKVGSAKTNGRGQWAIDRRNPPAGSYYAKVKGGFVNGGGTCSSARSSVLKVG